MDKHCEIVHNWTIHTIVRSLRISLIAFVCRRIHTQSTRVHLNDCLMRSSNGTNGVITAIIHSNHFLILDDKISHPMYPMMKLRQLYSDADCCSHTHTQSHMSTRALYHQIDKNQKLCNFMFVIEHYLIIIMASNGQFSERNWIDRYRPKPTKLTGPVQRLRCMVRWMQ